MSETKRKRYLSDVITPATVDACKDWASTEDYRDAAAMVPGMAARHADPDDVAGLALVLLGDCLATGLQGSLAAGSAVKRAVQVWQGMTLGEATPVGDTFQEDSPGTHLPRPFIPAPDGIATWSDADTLATLLSLLTPEEVLLLGLAFSPECQATDKRARHGVDAVAIASALEGREVKRGRLSAAWLDRVTLALQEARSWTADVVAILDLESASMGKGTDAVRWEDVVTGTASPVVCTAPAYGPCREGAVNDWSPGTVTWSVLPGGHVLAAARHEDLSDLLRWTDALPAMGAPTVRESRDADLLASTDAGKSARPIVGVTAGLRAGHGVAGTGSAFRVQASRKRKRDGGIGGPMTRA